jgi:pilus assembly protein CpaE
MLQAAAMDRRMSKAHVTPARRHSGGCPGLPDNTTPNVLLESQLTGRILAELGQLAQVCQPTTKVIVVGHLNDVILYRELIRQGVSEYLVAPLGQMQIIETVASLYQDPKSEPLGRIVAFVGAKGGVGSSTIAHNIAWALSKNHGLETVITDLDWLWHGRIEFQQDSRAVFLTRSASRTVWMPRCLIVCLQSWEKSSAC